MYLECMVAFGKFAGEVWDNVFSAGATNSNQGNEIVPLLDAKIKDWLDNVLPTIPLLPVNGAPSRTHLRQQTLVHTVGIRFMVSLI